MGIYVQVLEPFNIDEDLSHIALKGKSLGRGVQIFRISY
jgi:hypothetical protein